MTFNWRRLKQDTDRDLRENNKVSRWHVKLSLESILGGRHTKWDQLRLSTYVKQPRHTSVLPRGLFKPCQIWLSHVKSKILAASCP